MNLDLQKSSGNDLYATEVNELVGAINRGGKTRLLAALNEARSRPVRIILTGTSIATFSVSALPRIASELSMIYGTAGISIPLFGYGGTFNAQGTFQKQNFGQAPYGRLLVSPSGDDFVFDAWCKSMNIVYSKETSGGSSDIFADDNPVKVGTINCNGAQIYEQVFSYEFAEYGYHKLRIAKPTGGTFYLQKMEVLNGRPGLIIEDCTMGGYSAKDSYLAHERAVSGGNAAPITIVGENGVDGIAARTGVTKADLIIVQHFTNDGLPVPFRAFWERTATQTKALNVPVVMISEQPALQFVGSNGKLNNQRSEIYAILKEYAAKYEHITFLDWVAMVDFSTPAIYDSIYFPGADKTHPSENGHSIIYGALCDAFGLQPSGYRFAGQLAAEKGGTPFYGSTLTKYGNDVASPQNAIIGGRYRQLIGQSIDMVEGAARPLYLSMQEQNLAFAQNRAIQNAATADEFGKHVLITGGDRFYFSAPFTGVADEEITLVFLARGTSQSIDMINTGNNKRPALMYRDKIFSTGTIPAGFRSYPQPAYISVTIKRNPTEDNLSVNYAGSILGDYRIYGFWVVEGAVPTITPLASVVPLTTTSMMPALMTVDKVGIGKQYIQSDSTMLVVAKATYSIANRPSGLNAGVPTNIFECTNKYDVNSGFMLTGRGNLTYNEELKSYLSDHEDAGFGYTADRLKADTVYTMLVELAAGMRVGIRFFNDGNNNQLRLNPTTKLWERGGGQIYDMGGASSNGACAYTFKMPSQADLDYMGGGYILIRIMGNPKQSGVITMVKGIVPCV